jgi:hypothetical protein
MRIMLKNKLIIKQKFINFYKNLVNNFIKMFLAFKQNKKWWIEYKRPWQYVTWVDAGQTKNTLFRITCIKINAHKPIIFKEFKLIDAE